jgi:hypothetical protein
MTAYRHRQASPLILAAGVASAAWLATWSLMWHDPLLWLPAAAFAAAGVLFFSLTVEVADGELRWFFGPGLWRQRVALAEIAAVAEVPSRWWEGWGIHLTPRGWLYNVYGRGAVEIVLRSGRRFRLGTDEPQALLEALRETTSTPS